jgi:glycosyltransferase involved in cell wall biosynthesis
MKKVLIVAGFSRSLKNFRGDLIKSWLKKGYGIIAAAPGNEAETWLEELGASYYSIPLSRTGLNPFKDIYLMLQLKKIIKVENPDYLFLYTIKPVIYGSLAAYFYKQCQVFSMITGLGYVFTEGLIQNTLLQKIVVLLYRIALKRNNKGFFQNPDDIDFSIKLKMVNPEKVVLVNGSGVNLDYYQQTVLPTGPITFLLISRLIKEKGISEYVEAAGFIKAKYPEVIFKMIGWELEGGQSAISQEQVKIWQQQGNVDIIGETDDVRPYIESASVYVLPSYREGTPRTVLEAMAMGRAIITTDVPGCRETVVEGLNGFLVSAGDSTALASAMEYFVNQPELIESMGKASRKIAEEKYDVQKVNQVINEAMGLAGE